MSPPGADTSTVEPKLEYGALVRSGPTDATLITFRQEAGVAGALVLLLPAAATRTTPCARTDSKSSSTVSSQVPSAPKLMLMTLAGCEGRVPESLLRPAA